MGSLLGPKSWLDKRWELAVLLEPGLSGMEPALDCGSREPSAESLRRRLGAADWSLHASAPTLEIGFGSFQMSMREVVSLQRGFSFNKDPVGGSRIQLYDGRLHGKR